MSAMPETATTSPRGTTSAEARAIYEAQGPIEPGTEGWWQVWGARPCHIRRGDLIVTREGDGLAFDLIDANPVDRLTRVGLSSDGKPFTLGLGAGVVVLRWGTKHTLVGDF